MNIGLVLTAYLKARLRKRWNRARIRQHQSRRIKRMVRYAKDHSPFYKRLYGAKTQLRELPIITKTDMMNHFSDFNTKGLEKEEAVKRAHQGERSREFDAQYKGVSIGLSSGTSGNQGLFVTSDKEQALWAGSVLAKTLPSSILSKHSIGLILRSNNQLYEQIGSKNITFHYFDLQHPFEVLIKEVEVVQPSILVAPPSILRLLADHKLCYTPDKIIACAEVLDKIDAEAIKRYFQRRVDQIYQCTEGFLATTCSHGTLHINEDLVLVEKEYIDQKSGRFNPIITDLYRTTQPMIRYKLNDVLVEKKGACACGSHFLALEKVEGRCDDILYLRHIEQGLVPIFADFIRREILLASSSIEDYQVVQPCLEEMTIYTSPFVPMEKVLRNYFVKMGVVVPHIRQVDQPIKWSAWDKKRRVIRGFDV